jgi:hypothetical protein
MYFVTSILNLLVINQLPTFNPLTIGPLITIDPGLFTTTNPSVITRPPPTTSTITQTSTGTTTLTSTSFTSTAPSEEDNTILYIVLSVVFGLFAVFEIWYFIFRNKKNDNVRVENIERLYDSIDYSGVYELPQPEEYTNENPPPVPEKPKYGVQVNTII